MVPWTLLTGSVAGLFSKGIEAWNKKKDQEFEMKKIDKQNDHEVTMMGLETDKAIKVADTAALGRTIETQDREISALAVLAAKAGPKMVAFMSFVSIMLTAAQKSVRINLSYGLAGYACFMVWQLHQRVNGLEAFDNDEALGIYKMAIISVFDLTELAISYWFTSRPTSSWKSMLGMKK
jgi:hypothetical protein